MYYLYVSMNLAVHRSLYFLSDSTDEKLPYILECWLIQTVLGHVVLNLS